MVEIVGCSTSHPAKARPMPAATCIEAGCSKLARARGRCTTHYQQWRRENLPSPPERSSSLVCPMCGPWERLPSQTLASSPSSPSSPLQP